MAPPSLTALLALAVTVLPAAAQVPGWGRCPQPPVKQNFQLSQYLGRWYEVERYVPIVFELGNKCGQANYALLPEGGVNVTNIGYNVFSHEISVAYGRATTPDANVPAKLQVSFGSEISRGNYWVLDTDYTSYSIVYSCSELGPFVHTEIMWILGRERTLSEEKLSQLKEFTSSLGLRPRFLRKPSQNGCSEF